MEVAAKSVPRFAPGADLKIAVTRNFIEPSPKRRNAGVTRTGPPRSWTGNSGVRARTGRSARSSFPREVVCAGHKTHECSVKRPRMLLRLLRASSLFSVTADVDMPAASGLAACSRVEPPRPGEQRSGLFLVRQNGRLGFVNSRGQVKIAPQFDQAGPFSDGLAAVSVGGRAGYIDTDGKFVINPQFDGGAPFSEGLAAVQIGDAWGFIDKHGKLVIPPQFQPVGDMRRCSSAAVSPPSATAPARPSASSTATAAWPSRRITITPCRSPTASRWSASAAVTATSTRTASASSTRSSTRPAASSKIAPRCASADRWGYIDRAGKMVVNPQFDAARAFSDGLALVAIGNRIGFIDHDGKMVINPQFDAANDFRDGRAPVRVGGRWGYIDKAGKMVIRPQFENARPFSPDLAPVQVGLGLGLRRPRRQVHLESNRMKLTARNVKFAWKYRHFLWKYRKCDPISARNRRRIAVTGAVVGAGCAR